jgi:hypothetical protein
MSIDIVVTGAGLTVSNVGQAVWAALAADNNTPLTMGEKLNDAGSASNPWTEELPGTYTGDQAGKIIADIKDKANLISTDIVSANPAYMHNPIIDQANIVVAQVGLIRNKPSADPIQISEITVPGLIKIWRYRKGIDSNWTLIIAGGGMGAGIGSVYYQYTFPSTDWQDGDLILYEVYNTVITLGTETFTLSTVQGFGVIGETIAGALIIEIAKLTGNKVTKSGDIITIYEDNGITPWKQYNLANGGRVEI